MEDIHCDVQLLQIWTFYLFIYLFIYLYTVTRQLHVPLQNINPLNAELNPINPFLALFRAHHILNVSR